MVRVGFIDTSPFWKYSYGEYHPLKMYRLYLTQELQKFKGLLEDVEVLQPSPLNKDFLRKFHDEDYLNILEIADEGIFKDFMVYYGLGTGDCPVVKGIYSASLLSAGASYISAKYVIEKGFRSFNMAGGLHHAHRDRASGFCYINDPVMSIYALLEHFERVLYLDIDGHHGDGVQEAFYTDGRVLTISIHESGRYLFPGTGFEDEMGLNGGYGYNLNLPFPPGSGDDVYRKVFDEVVVPAVERFKPDVIVLQSGADSLRGDPLTHWNLTTNSYIHVYDFVISLNLPIVALGGGGYNIGNVCRLWTILLAKLMGVEIDNMVPGEWNEIAGRYGISLSGIFDIGETVSDDNVKLEIKRVKEFLKNNHPLLI